MITRKQFLLSPLLAFFGKLAPKKKGDPRSAFRDPLRLPAILPSNPAAIILEILRRQGWADSQIDLPSFSRAAEYCATAGLSIDSIPNDTLAGTLLDICLYTGLNLGVDPHRKKFVIERLVINTSTFTWPCVNF